MSQDRCAHLDAASQRDHGVQPGSRGCAECPVIRSFEPGEDWAYCYVDDAYAEALAPMPGEAAPRHYAPR